MKREGVERIWGKTAGLLCERDYLYGHDASRTAVNTDSNFAFKVNCIPSRKKN